MAKKHQIKVSSKKGRNKAARKWRRQEKQALRNSLAYDGSRSSRF